MGRIDEAIRAIERIEDGTERALQLGGLISTLFKIKGVALIVTHDLAFDAYADTVSEYPELDLAAFAGDLTPRIILEIMRGQVEGSGSLYRWVVAGIPVRFQKDVTVAKRELCREITTDHGVIKLVPVEEITADYILAAVYPEPNMEAYERAHHLLVNGLSDSFEMNWAVLQELCHRPEYRVGDDLAQMRVAAKQEVDALGTGRDHVGDTKPLPKITAEEAPRETAPKAETLGEAAVDLTVTNGGAVTDALPDH
jgi:hypothetical protein